MQNSAPPGVDDWQNEMRVTFDQPELESFYDGFSGLPDPCDLFAELEDPAAGDR